MAIKQSQLWYYFVKIFYFCLLFLLNILSQFKFHLGNSTFHLFSRFDSLFCLFILFLKLKIHKYYISIFLDFFKFNSGIIICI